jgi:hypothetical protein
VVVGRVVVVVAPGHGCLVSHSYCWIVTDRGPSRARALSSTGLALGIWERSIAN